MFLEKFYFIYSLIYFWLCWVFIAMGGLSLFAASRGYSSLRGFTEAHCMCFLLWWLPFVWSMSSRHVGSGAVGHGLSCLMTCRIIPDQGQSPYFLHWQVDS